MIDARIVRYVSTRSQKYMFFFVLSDVVSFGLGQRFRWPGWWDDSLNFLGHEYEWWATSWYIQWLSHFIEISPRYPMVIPFIQWLSNGYPMVIQWAKKDRMDDAFPTISRCPRYLIFTRHLWLGVAHQYPVWQSPRICWIYFVDLKCWNSIW